MHASTARLIVPALAVALVATACADDGAQTEADASSSGGPSSAESSGTGSGQGSGQGSGGDDAASSSAGPSTSTSATSTSSASSSSAQVSSAQSTGAGGEGGGGTGGGGTGGGGAGTVRFIAMGDGGEPGPMQSAVALVVADVCRTRGGCDFAVYLGDNMYDDGVSGVDDQQFQDKFEIPYAGLPFPFKVVLGNHDYGGNGAGYEPQKAQYEIDYTALSQKWQLPEHYYAFSTPADAGPPDATPVTFFGLDTNAILFGFGGDQQRWLETGIATSTSTWKIALGHHPYISNGQHGNAGEYEGIPFIPIVSGGDVRDFVEDSICGKVDVYLSGHDHNRQWLAPQCGVEFIVSGTAAKVTDLVGRGTDTLFEEDANGGFLIIEITGNMLTGDFYDETGVLEFSRTITK